jgi:hypothetical protein
MLCKSYFELTPVERILFIGELTHACMCDDDLYELGKKLIELGMKKGIFNNVNILPEDNKLNDN